MKTYKKQLFGTNLEIGLQSNIINEKIIDDIFEMVENFEKKYSRFIEGNYLWKLNQSKKAPLTPEMQTMISVAQKLHALSDGYFDITVLPYLENIGYGGIQKTKNTTVGMENILIKNNEIILKNDICIELGGVGKGYMIDVIFHELTKHFDDFIINFGGDIRVNGKHIFSLEDPLDTKKYIGKICLENNALAGSASNKRKTEKGHHLIDIKKGKSEDEKLAVFVTYKVASLADGFATTLFVTPLEKSLEILKKVQGLEGVIIMKNGEMYQTKNFNLKK